MTGLIAFILMLAVSFSPAPNVATDEVASDSRFTTVDIYLDSGDTPLAVYQLEFKATAGQVKIVGIEGGEHPAFSEPPYYDSKAIQQQRVILASFNTADATELPAGKSRVATIHLQVAGEAKPQYAIELTVAADDRGDPIQATAEFQEQTP